MGMKQKENIFFEKKISKWPTKKKLIFQFRQFSIFFCENFMDYRLVLRLVGLIDAKGIDVAQPMWS